MVVRAVRLFGRARRSGTAGAAVLVLLLAGTGCTQDSNAAPSTGAPLLTDFPSSFEPPEAKPEPMPQPAKFGGASGDVPNAAGGCPDGWSCETAADPRIELDNETVKNGEQSLRVRFDKPDGSFSATSERLPVRTGREVGALVPMRSSIRGEAAESVTLRFYDSDGRHLDSATNQSPKHGANAWYSTSLSTEVPSDAETMTVTVQARGYDRTVWFDQAVTDDHPRIEVWGGTGLHTKGEQGRMTLQLRTPSEEGVYAGAIEAFGQRYYVAGPKTMLTTGGQALRYRLRNGISYVSEKDALHLPRGQTGTITLSGDSLHPTDGSGYPKVVLDDTVNVERYHVWVAVKDNVTDTEELRSVVRFVYADRLSETVRGLSAYLDERRRPDGGWQVAHENYPGDEQPDPMAIARLVQGYVYLAEVSGDPEIEKNSEQYEERGKGGLDWLVRNQHDDGGFGLPWEFGSTYGHLGGHMHYPGQEETTHPAGHPYAISTAIAGEALLDGYRAFGDDRYLQAARKVADYLLKSENGFQWVDEDKTRGSIPYCTLEPVMEADDPRARAHDVVAPLRNTAIEVYNIDGASLSFFTSLYKLDKDEELLRYGDALARNLTLRMHDSGSMPYAWYHDHYYSGGYPRIVYNGLREWGQLRGSDGREWVAAANKGFSWLANEVYAALLPTEGYSTAHGLGLSGDNGDYINRLLRDVRKDGSYSGGSNTRKDATNFAVLAELSKAIEE